MISFALLLLFAVPLCRVVAVCCLPDFALACDLRGARSGNKKTRADLSPSIFFRGGEWEGCRLRVLLLENLLGTRVRKPNYESTTLYAGWRQGRQASMK